MGQHIYLLGSNQKRETFLDIRSGNEIAEATDWMPLLWLALHRLDEKRKIPVTIKAKALTLLAQRTDWLATYYSNPEQLVECSEKLAKAIEESKWKYVTLEFNDLESLTDGRFGQNFTAALRSFEKPTKRTLSALKKICVDEVLTNTGNQEVLIGISTIWKRKSSSKKSNQTKTYWKDAPTPKGWKHQKTTSQLKRYQRHEKAKTWEGFEQAMTRIWRDILPYFEQHECVPWKCVLITVEPAKSRMTFKVSQSEPDLRSFPRTSGERFEFCVDADLLKNEFENLPEMSGRGFNRDNAIRKLEKTLFSSIRSAAKAETVKAELKALRKVRKRSLGMQVKAKNYCCQIDKLVKTL